MNFVPLFRPARLIATWAIGSPLPAPGVDPGRAGPAQGLWRVAVAVERL